jgi:hypothetical protein
MSIYKSCEVCKRTIVAIRYSKKYCSQACKIYAYRARRIEKQKIAAEMAILREILQLQREHSAKINADFEKFKANYAADHKPMIQDPEA